MYVRSRSLVVTPKTTFQVAAQNVVKTLSSRWATLTSAQRAAWKTYAINVPLLNKLGESRIIPELSMYIRCNAPRLLAVGPSAIIDAAPTTFALAVLTAPTFTATSPTSLSVAFTNTDAWATTTGGYLIIQGSRPLAPTRLFPKAAFRFLGTVAGLTATPPTSPQAKTSAFTLATGQQVMLRVTASNSDGRLSAAQIITAIAI